MRPLFHHKLPPPPPPGQEIKAAWVGPAGHTERPKPKLLSEQVNQGVKVGRITEKFKRVKNKNSRNKTLH